MVSLKLHYLFLTLAVLPCLTSSNVISDIQVLVEEPILDYVVSHLINDPFASNAKFASACKTKSRAIFTNCLKCIRQSCKKTVCTPIVEKSEGFNKKSQSARIVSRQKSPKNISTSTIRIGPKFRVQSRKKRDTIKSVKEKTQKFYDKIANYITKNITLPVSHQLVLNCPSAEDPKCLKSLKESFKDLKQRLETYSPVYKNGRRIGELSVSAITQGIYTLTRIIDTIATCKDLEECKKELLETLSVGRENEKGIFAEIKESIVDLFAAILQSDAMKSIRKTLHNWYNKARQSILNIQNIFQSSETLSHNAEIVNTVQYTLASAIYPASNPRTIKDFPLNSVKPNSYPNFRPSVDYEFVDQGETYYNSIDQNSIIPNRIKRFAKNELTIGQNLLCLQLHNNSTCLYPKNSCNTFCSISEICGKKLQSAVAIDQILLENNLQWPIFRILQLKMENVSEISHFIEKKHIKLDLTEGTPIFFEYILFGQKYSSEHILPSHIISSIQDLGNVLGHIVIERLIKLF